MTIPVTNLLSPPNSHISFSLKREMKIESVFDINTIPECRPMERYSDFVRINA
jgi:hypothetical protein